MHGHLEWLAAMALQQTGRGQLLMQRGGRSTTCAKVKTDVRLQQPKRQIQAGARAVSGPAKELAVYDEVS